MANESFCSNLLPNLIGCFLASGVLLKKEKSKSFIKKLLKFVVIKFEKIFFTTRNHVATYYQTPKVAF